MACDPEKHRRRSIRLPAYDYRLPGTYFATLCLQGRPWLFGEVCDGEVILSGYGRIAEEEWLRTPEIRPGVALDAYVIMPDHVHVVFHLAACHVHGRRDMMHHVPTRPDGAAPSMEPVHVRPDGAAQPLDATPARSFGKPVAGSVSSILATYKAAVTRRVNRLQGTPGAVLWQPRFYKHVVRDARDLDRIRRYVAANPSRWGTRGQDPA